ncbi:hypothetical protein QUF56_03055 [Ureibacillus composti]|nr:hypothetical protein [Ureibacillus composti]
MKGHSFIYLILAIFVVLMVGCSNKATQHDDEYYNVKLVAWEFLKEKGWDGRAKENWETAEVFEVMTDDDYKLIDPSYKGKLVLSVIFEDKENAVIGTPIVLVDPEKNEVVGFMYGE